MRITKPYGRTKTVAINDEKERKLYVQNNPKKISDFVVQKQELLIAQWVSILDKIAKKPIPKKNKLPYATKEQIALREKLFNAAWAFLVEKKLISETPELKNKWEQKKAPYQNKEDDKKHGDEKGKWYQTFAGEIDSSEIDATKIVQKIYVHLHQKAFRLNKQEEQAGVGLIENRAKSIERNVLSLKPKEIHSHSLETKEKYEQKVGNVAEKIINKLNDKNNPKSANATAGEVLFEAWKNVFGENTNYEEANKKFPELFLLHQAIKNCYTKLFKQKVAKRDQLAKRAPKNMSDLFFMLTQKEKNQNTNLLIRKGKIIHYKKIDNTTDYTTTDGQIEIKQTEAFVRVWRYALALASRTLKDWADPENNIDGDILMGRQRSQVATKFEQNEKLKLLFGKNEFSKTDEINFLSAVLQKTADLRNATFHFKKLENVIKALKSSPETQDIKIFKNYAEKLTNEDEKNRQAQLIETLTSLKLEKFFSKAECTKIIESLNNVESSLLPLPNFKKLIVRANNLNEQSFPKKPTSIELNLPAYLCKYSTLKLIYDKPFSNYLEKMQNETLKTYIKKVVKSSDHRAQTINRNNEVSSKIAKVVERLDELKNINDFFYELTAETASLMQVQSGYSSNEENSKDQAEFIEDFKRDVILLAFKDFLKAKDFEFVLRLEDEKTEEQQSFTLQELSTTSSQRSYEAWQKELYIILHLIPVNEINTLYHQLKKWLILTNKSKRIAEQAEAKQISEILELYLEMHDTKFCGSDEALLKNFENLFENKADFNQIFKPNATQPEQKNLLRGLREMLRFGGEKSLRSVFEAHKITSNQIAEWGVLKEKIAQDQKTCQNLHKELQRKEGIFETQDKQNLKTYIEALQNIIKYREINNHVMLINHVRLHRLMMNILTRFTDFTGLWERDLYFITNALLEQQNKKPEDVFADKLKEFNDGQIVKALKNKVNKITGLDSIYNKEEDKKEGLIFYAQKRNDFAHFNMLQAKSLPVNLTEETNKARELMSYDRKLKNAVTKSIIDIMDREGFNLKGEMNSEHNFVATELETKQISHLKKLTAYAIQENFHGETFSKMVASLWENKYKGKEDITKKIVDDELKNILKPKNNDNYGGKKHEKKPFFSNNKSGYAKHHKR